MELPESTGTYTLVVELETPQTLTVGSLGAIEFSAGGYAYTGSAFGAGGLSRVERHHEILTGDRDVRHWHIDYLAGCDDTQFVDVTYVEGVDIECQVAQHVAGDTIPDFGASDCDCLSHLVHTSDVRALVDEVEDTYRSLTTGARKRT